MSSIVVVPGSNYYEEARELASTLNCGSLEVKHKIFPDGEKYLRILDAEKLVNNVVVVANTMYPNQNDSLLETLMLIHASIKAGASKVIAFVPYLAYARQDKVFLHGEPVTADIVVSALKAIGTSCLLTIDVHSPNILERNIDCYENVLVFDELYKVVKTHVNDPIIMAPDKGALHRARYIAEKEGLEYDYLVKHRDRETGSITIKPKELDVNGRDIVLVDDIISTGGTIAEASRILLQQGARKVIVCASHGLLIGNAVEKIIKSGVYRIVLANTLGLRYDMPMIEYVDVIPRVAEVLAKYA